MACEICSLIKKGAKKIFEDDNIIAILHTRPASIGHILVMPKAHYPIIEQVPDYVVSNLFKIVNRISMIAFEVLKIQGTNLIITNGVAAGQKYNHFMVNIIPRGQGDGLNFQWKPKQLTEEEMSTAELQIKEHTKNIGGFEKEPEAPVEIKGEAEIIPDDQENYLIKQLRRIP